MGRPTRNVATVAKIYAERGICVNVRLNHLVRPPMGVANSTAATSRRQDRLVTGERQREVLTQSLNAALDRLAKAGALWKNEATEVWSFVAGTGLISEIEKVVAEELQMVPDYEPARLLRYHPEIQEDIADRIGDFDLDPNEAGIVRRIGVRILDIAHPENAIEPVNPARDGGQEAWRSALIYLVPVDTTVQLDYWRRRAAEVQAPNVCFVFPREEVRLDQSRLREFIAVTRALEKNPAGHIHEVLDSRYTRLRTELRQQFEQAFGNAGLRAGPWSCGPEPRNSRWRSNHGTSCRPRSQKTWKSSFRSRSGCAVGATTNGRRERSAGRSRMW